MDTKICIICGEEKEISEYYKHQKMADGHLNKCKQCTKDGVKKRYYQLSNNPEWVESERSRHKEKYHRLGYKEKQLKLDANRPWTRDSTYKSLKKKIKTAVRLGNIPGLNSVQGLELHHWNYNKLESFFLLTPSQHKQLHAQLTFDEVSLTYKHKDRDLSSPEEHAIAILAILGLQEAVRLIQREDGEFRMTMLPF